MKVSKIDSVWILEFMPHTVPINCYLVEEEKELTLIDCGLPFCSRGILKQAELIGKPITKLLFTHLHTDHTGAMEALLTKQPNIKLYVPQVDYQYVNTKNKTKESKGLAFPKSIIPNYLVSEHDVIGSVEAISTPGHTVGSVSFYHKKLGILFCGDAMQTRAGIAVAGDMRILFPFVTLATWNRKKSVMSAKKLNQLEIRVLAPGHGHVRRNPHKKIREVIKRAEAKCKK